MLPSLPCLPGVKRRGVGAERPALSGTDRPSSELTKGRRRPTRGFNGGGRIAHLSLVLPGHSPGMSPSTLFGNSYGFLTLLPANPAARGGELKIVRRASTMAEMPRATLLLKRVPACHREAVIAAQPSSSRALRLAALTWRDTAVSLA